MNAMQTSHLSSREQGRKIDQTNRVVIRCDVRVVVKCRPRSTCCSRRAESGTEDDWERRASHSGRFEMIIAFDAMLLKAMTFYLNHPTRPCTLPRREYRSSPESTRQNGRSQRLKELVS